MKCYNKECNNFEKGRDTTDCIILYPNEVESCIEFIDEQTYNKVNNIEILNECEYVYTNKNRIALRGCNDLWEDAYLIKRYKYCPYCSKPIKIKDHV
jgi:hypothetical protein